MKRKTLVLDINELYSAIPECKILENKNFKDIRELLKELITAIEKSGQWEFIQHVQNKPSLFVIRETVKIVETKKTEAEVSVKDLLKLEERINGFAKVLAKINEAKTHPDKFKKEILEDIKEVEEQVKDSIYNNPLFGEKDILNELPMDLPEIPGARLPWEK